MAINKWMIAVVVVLTGGVGWAVTHWGKATHAAQEKIIHVRRGDIQTVISTTGTVLPKNRLEIKPPVNGRIEQVLVKEGQLVKTGDVVVMMSSSDRAALMDAARGKGEETFKYWQDVYKPIPLVAPIDGEVIVGTVQPGQMLTTADAAIVLSDRLIVRAQVDETDIGKIREGQNAVIALDAYPGEKINAAVDHIYHESSTVNNVTVYQVDLTPEAIPAYFRSGMNATVDFIQESRKGVLTLPVTAIHKDPNGGSYVLLRSGQGAKPESRALTPGLSDDKRVEVVSGVTEEDDVIVEAKKFSKARPSGTNPFMPARPKGAGGR